MGSSAVRRHADASTVAYDATLDTLIASIVPSSCTYGEETDGGFIVHYDCSNRSIAGVTIECFRRRFGERAREIEIDAEPPFLLRLG